MAVASVVGSMTGQRTVGYTEQRTVGRILGGRLPSFGVAVVAWQQRLAVVHSMMGCKMEHMMESIQLGQQLALGLPLPLGQQPVVVHSMMG